MRAAAHFVPDSTTQEAAQKRIVSWEYFQGGLANTWEVWHSEEIGVWQSVTVPHCFNSYDGCDPDVPYYRGPGWYRTHIELANPFANGRTLLHFEGAGQKADLYVGSTFLGSHVGGYDEFFFDITDAAVAETSKDKKGLPVAVLCDNSRDMDRSPSDLSDFSLYGGLYRHVNLIYVPAISFGHIHILPKVVDAKNASVSIQGKLYNPTGIADPVQVDVEIRDAKDKVLHHSSKKIVPGTDEAELDTFSLERYKTWSPAAPYLYSCRITLTSQEVTSVYSERFGIRSYEFLEHGPFHLNGERLLIRGTQRHADHAGYAAAMPDDLVKQELQMIKDMGANFIRLAHYQQSRLVLDLCDELGLMVWEEAPWCRSGIGNLKFRDQIKVQLQNMIEQHFNHPSVILWGLGNEDDWPTEYPEINKDAIRAFMTELRDLAHSLDSSRLTSFRRCDIARDIPDVYSPSIWAGWYRGSFTDYQATTEKERDRVKHFLHMEWGADSHAGRHAEDPYATLRKPDEPAGKVSPAEAYLHTDKQKAPAKEGDWSETYACDLFDWHLKTQETLPWLSGSAQWVFKDFTTPLRPENPVPRINQKGVTERDLSKKEGYYVFQSYWSDEFMVHIYGHSWPMRWGEPDEEKLVRVYSNGDRVELFLNGRSLGMKHRNSQDYPCAGLRWMAHFNEGDNQLRAVAWKGNKSLADGIEFIYQTEKWEEPHHLELIEKSHKGDVITLEALLVDVKGVRCLDSHATVRFRIAGGGQLIDNLGTACGSRVVQLYNGRAELSFLKKNGPSAVSVTADKVIGAILECR